MSSAEPNEPESDQTSEGLVQTVTPDVIRRSFALKFSIALLVMGLLVVGMGVGATDLVKGETEQNVNAEYENVALQESDIVERWTTRNRLAVKLVSSNTDWATGEGDRVALTDQQSDLPRDVRDIHIVERGASAGSTVVSSTTLNSGDDFASDGRSWFSDASFGQEGQVRMSAVYRDGNTPVIGFASPVASAENRFMVFEYELGQVTQSLQGADRAEGGFTQVVSSDGTVMLAEPPSGDRGIGEDVLQEYSTSEGANRPIAAANDLRDTREGAGVLADMEPNAAVIDDTYVVGYAPVQGTDWVVLVHAPSSSVFGFVQQIQTWGIAATMVTAILIVAIGSVIGINTSRSITKLTNKTSQMREGELGVDLTTSRIDEIGGLYEGFADMRDSLVDQIEEAKRSRKEAEVSRAEAMEMNDYLQAKAKEFSQAMESAAGGDMTRRMETDNENESMDRIATAFNDMIEELEKTTGQLQSFADEVAESGEVVLTSAESVRDASEQVADSVQQISDHGYNQQERLKTVSEDIDQFVDTLEQLQADNPSVEFEDSMEELRAMATSIQEAADISEQMMAESESVAGAAEEQAAELNEVSSRAEKLKRYASPLGDILGRFETEAEHEFVFSGGPSPGSDDSDD